MRDSKCVTPLSKSIKIGEASHYKTQCDIPPAVQMGWSHTQTDKQTV